MEENKTVSYQSEFERFLLGKKEVKGEDDCKKDGVPTKSEIRKEKAEEETELQKVQQESERQFERFLLGKKGVKEENNCKKDGVPTKHEIKKEKVEKDTELEKVQQESERQQVIDEIKRRGLERRRQLEAIPLTSERKKAMLTLAHKYRYLNNKIYDKMAIKEHKMRLGRE